MLEDFNFYIRRREKGPAHIRVESRDGYAIFDRAGDSFFLREEHGIRAVDLKEIEKFISVNREPIIKKMKEPSGN